MHILKIFYIFTFIPSILTISSSANEPIADNELGLTARDCALQYCKSKNGYELWLTLQKRCKEHPNPY